MFPAVVRLRGPRTPIALVTALTALIVAATPVGAVGWTSPKTLASPGTYWSNSVATENNNVVVSWLEDGSHLVFRTSTNKGRTFNPPVDLGTANPGAVTLCGGLVVGVRVDTGTGTVKLDVRIVSGHQSSWVIRTIASGRSLTETGIGVACVGGRRIATFWDEYVGAELHLKVAVLPVFLAMTSYEFDLGAAPIYRVRGITATDTGIWVGWSNDDAVIVQRLNVGSGAQMIVTEGTRKELHPECAASSVGIAVTGDRVYVAYECPNKAVIRASNNRGRSFGAERVLFRSASEPVGMYGLAASQNVVAASIHLGPWCVGCVGSNLAVYSVDLGRTWTEGPSNTGGYMPAVALLGSGSSMRIAAAWDNRTSHETYGDPGYVKFSTGWPWSP